MFCGVCGRFWLFVFVSFSFFFPWEIVPSRFGFPRNLIFFFFKKHLLGKKPHKSTPKPRPALGRKGKPEIYKALPPIWKNSPSGERDGLRTGLGTVGRFGERSPLLRRPLFRSPHPPLPFSVSLAVISPVFSPAFSGRRPRSPPGRHRLKRNPAPRSAEGPPRRPPARPFWGQIRARMLVCVPRGGDTPNSRFARSPAPGLRGDEGSPHPRPKGANLLFPQTFHREMLENRAPATGFEEGGSVQHTHTAPRPAQLLLFSPFPGGLVPNAPAAPKGSLPVTSSGKPGIKSFT